MHSSLFVKLFFYFFVFFIKLALKREKPAPKIIIRDDVGHPGQDEEKLPFMSSRRVQTINVRKK